MELALFGHQLFCGDVPGRACFTKQNYKQTAAVALAATGDRFGGTLYEMMIGTVFFAAPVTVTVVCS